MPMSKYASYNRNTGTEIKLSCPSLLKLVQQILDNGDTLKSDRFILFRQGGRHAATKNEQKELSQNIPQGDSRQPPEHESSAHAGGLADLK